MDGQCLQYALTTNTCVVIKQVYFLHFAPFNEIISIYIGDKLKRRLKAQAELTSQEDRFHNTPNTISFT